MSEPRHAMIFKCDDGMIWLNIVPEAEADDDRTPMAAKTYGNFESIKQARAFADSMFQNTGSEIPLYIQTPTWWEEKYNVT